MKDDFNLIPMTNEQVLARIFKLKHHLYGGLVGSVCKAFNFGSEGLGFDSRHLH